MIKRRLPLESSLSTLQHEGARAHRCLEERRCRGKHGVQDAIALANKEAPKMRGITCEYLLRTGKLQLQFSSLWREKIDSI